MSKNDNVALFQTVNDEGDSAVSGDIASGAEGVHGDVEGNHQGAVLFTEAEHRREDAEGSHDGTAGHAW